MADLKEFEINNNVYKFKDETARNSISALQAAIGSPLVANTAASMVDTTKIYVYTGSETGYETGHWYYYNNGWQDGGLYQSRGIAANSVTGSKLALPIRSALMTFLQNVAMTTPNGQSLYQAVYNAFYDVAVESIEAVFTQGGNVILTSDSLDDLKQYLVVTAIFEDETEIEVSDYTLSGTLTAGTSIITVTYQDKTATFTVDVTECTDVAPSLSTFVAGNSTYAAVSYNSTADSLRVYTKSNRGYQTAHAAFTTEEGYSYKVSYDMAYVKGTHRSAFRTSSDSIVKAMTGNLTTSGHVEFVCEHNTSIADFCFYCTYSTTEAGDQTISNFHIYKYLTPVGE